MAHMYIVEGDDGIFGKGKSLLDAYHNYVDQGGDESAENVFFYVATEVEVEIEVQLKIVTTPEEITAKK